VPSLAALATAGLLAGLGAVPVSPLTVGGGDVSAEAGAARFEGATGRYLLEDGVVIRRGLVVLRARSAIWDPATHEVQATGDVLLTDVGRVLAAQGMRAVIDGPFQADGVVAFLKDGPVALGDAATLEQARRTGRNRGVLLGDHVEGETSRFQVSGARLTLCDCGAGAPTWELRAREADVVSGERVTLSWPVLYVTPRFLGVDHPVPILPLPWLSLPLSDRQTGLLPTLMGSTGATGFTIGQPVFVTLGRSADLTVTPSYMLGNTASAVEQGKASVQGPGAQLELRWAPAEHAEGRIAIDWVHDLQAEPGGASGDRFAFNGAHAQQVGDATRVRAELALATDPVWYRDFTSDILLRSSYYARSDALASWAKDAGVIEASAAYLEPLDPIARNPAAGPYGAFGADVPVFHRWPSIAATLLPEPLGPLSLSGRLGLSRFAPMTGDGGPAVAWGDPGAHVTTDWNGETVPGSATSIRSAATRLDARAEVSAPLLLGEVASLTPYLRGAAAGYRFDLDDLGTHGTAWAAGGVALASEVSRRFGTLVNRIAPRIEYRFVTAASGGGGAPVPAFDLWDRVRDEPQPFRLLSAAPQGSAQQLRVAVETRLDGQDSGLRLELGQDLDLAAGRAAESFFAGAGHAGWLSADVSGRAFMLADRPVPAPPPSHPYWLDHLSELRASLGLADRRGDALRGGLLSIGPGGSGTLMAGVDPLFDLRPAQMDASAMGTVQARAVLGAATLGYDGLVAARPQVVDGCSASAPQREVPAGHFLQHALSFVWDSPCHCFLAKAVLRMNDCGGLPSGSISIDLFSPGDRPQVR